MTVQFTLNKKIFFAVFTLMASLLLFIPAALQAQGQVEEEAPFREFTDPEKLVAFDRSVSFTEAIDVINEFVQEFEGKFIIDKSGYTGNIGLKLPSMHYKDALNFILDYQGLQLNETPEFYEIVVPEVQTQTTSGQPSAAATAAGGDGEVTANLETREVRINATFFEGNKRALQEIGVDWSTLTDDVPADIDDFVGDQAQEGLPNTAFRDEFVAVNSFGAQNVSQNAFNSLINFGQIGDSRISVQALFSAFEADNLGEVLATPSVKVIEGQEGMIQDGQDFSIKQRDFAGNVTDQFFSTGTILTVTPQVITKDDTSFIYLELEVERSSAQPDPVSTIVNKQEATSSVLLLDGETTVIAGLYRTTESRVRRGIPFLKDIPVLGRLFGFNSVDLIENELIILVQAELEKPLRERMDMALKTKRTLLDEQKDRHRNDLDYILDKTAESTPPLGEEIGAEETTEEPKQVDPPSQEEEPETLTPEQKKLAEELSMPVEKPELMVVVPKAFDLERFLELKEQGVEIEDPSQDLKYFVIGGSFIVPDNAYRFKDVVSNLGYDPYMLVNTATRFHFIAYEGYKKFENAYSDLLDIQQNVNSEAWLFTIEKPSEKIKENGWPNK